METVNGGVGPENLTCNIWCGAACVFGCIAGCLIDLAVPLLDAAVAFGGGVAAAEMYDQLWS